VSGPGLDQMGCDLSRGKITALHLEEEMNIEFGILDVRNFFVPRSGPVRYQKPIKHFHGLAVEDAAKFVLLSTKFEIDANED